MRNHQNSIGIIQAPIVSQGMGVTRSLTALEAEADSTRVYSISLFLRVQVQQNRKNALNPTYKY